jgi:hypothetical protein
MKWFKHDSDANQDAKLRRLRLKYGMEGYGLYWYCLEMVARGVEASRLTFELEHDAELIAADTGIHHERVQSMMLDMVAVGLFENSDGVITCLKMAHRTDEYTAKLLAKSKSVPTVSRQHLECVGGKSALLEEKRREEKKNNSDEYAADFLAFWNSWPEGFGSKGSKSDAFKEWRKAKGLPPTHELIAAACAQADEKAAKQAAGVFAENFKHICRWLKAREWENDAPSLAAAGEVYR